jgi:RNA polymerase sigma-70 factor (ECF subfamily)
VFERTAPVLVAWAHVRIPPRLRSQLDPEDLVQEVWCRAIDALPRYDPDRGSFRQWMFGIAGHVLLDALRHLRETATPHHASGSAAFALDGVRADVTSITRAAGRRDDVRRLLDAVAALEDDDRLLLRLRGLEERPFDEIAGKVASTPEALRKRWQRLRERLATTGADGMLARA